ncbi:MFS transporter [Flavobacterium sp. UMI-01]|uniref:MFS transporter n=1 Tax=Flavobacterium sp. UMI-01 TaxID=1441053 RepID=UPI001C7CCB68|nr:MFS transporter [Flavobacterium sp. UMI-01]GIZ08474.1 membrane protein [Flavobacterium sp. UMI-01]
MKKILFLIILGQFLCTSLWFAGNAILPDLILKLGVTDAFLAHSTSTIQLGFITGTLCFAILSIADRYSPSLVFLISAFVGAFFNLGITLPYLTPTLVLTCRFLTGFFLAGIYPVGIKIAADYYKEELGKSLGYLVGALVLGTAFPHLLKSFSFHFTWQYVVFITSFLACVGGFLVYAWVPDGPYRTKSTSFQVKAIFSAFQNKELSAAAVGYFGHMWELYAFWTFVPVMIHNYNSIHSTIINATSLLSFLVIASGSLACAISGHLSHYIGTKKLSQIILFLSATCCVISPLFLQMDSSKWFLAFLFFWSFVVIADSPLFSTLIAQKAPPDIKGSVVTLVNCIGFFITIVSIQLLSYFLNSSNQNYLFTILAIGPFIGLYFLKGKG